MKRVLQVVNRMGYGGIEAFLMNLYRNMDRKKIQFDFAVHTKEKGEYDNEIKELGGNIYYFTSRNEDLFKYYKDWNNFLKNKANMYNAIHMHVSSLTTILPLALAKKYNVNNRIIHAHNSFQKGSIHQILNKLNQFRIDQISTTKFACSTEAGRYVFGKRKFELIRNGIDAERYKFNQETREKIRKRYGIQEEQKVIINIGRLVKEKNQLFLLEILKEIKKKQKNVILFIIGRGYLKDEIQDKIKEYNLENNVVLIERHNSICDVLQGMDFFVLPSLYEGLPVVSIEAQASGLKCLISDNVSKELKITNLVTFKSLEDSAKSWADEILSEIEYERNDTKKMIRKAGYDIKNTAELITKYY